MIIDDRPKFVETVIDNIIRGNLVIHSNRVKIGKLMGEWIRQYNAQANDEKFTKLTDNLSVEFIVQRINGQLNGKIEEYDLQEQFNYMKEQNIQLLQDNERFTTLIQKLENEKAELKKHNIMLASELEDQKNIINSYENSTMNGK